MHVCTHAKYKDRMTFREVSRVLNDSCESEPALGHWKLSQMKLCLSMAFGTVTKRQNHISEFCTNKLRRDEGMTPKIIT